MAPSKLLRPLVCALLALTLLTPACFVSPAPDLRGWTCAQDRECPSSFFCIRGSCRPRCTEDADCQSALKERCSTVENDDPNRYCIPPCFAGSTQNCYTGPSGTNGVGTCQAGTQTCTPQLEWGPCVGETLPKAEVCGTQKDENCNGQADEGCSCKPNTTQECYSGRAGTKGIGACKAGTQTCDGNGQWGPCKNEVTPQSKEVCNGQDDDCNGQVDENIAEIDKPCTVPNAKGRCAQGISECQGGSLRCRQTKLPVSESCNNEDDDCDGKVDNNQGNSDFSVTRTCYNGTSGCRWDASLKQYRCTAPCRIGANKCLPQQGAWSQACDGEVVPKTEECNNIDDDCNGTIDDNIAGIGKTCDTGKKGICQEGKQQCENGQLICKQQRLPSSPDLCDGKDDDCDGQSDEGPNACPTGQSCSQGKCS